MEMVKRIDLLKENIFSNRINTREVGGLHHREPPPNSRPHDKKVIPESTLGFRESSEILT
jgi:hypothetical protein